MSILVDDPNYVKILLETIIKRKEGHTNLEGRESGSLAIYKLRLAVCDLEESRTAMGGLLRKSTFWEAVSCHHGAQQLLFGQDATVEPSASIQLRKNSSDSMLVQRRSDPSF
jgi:hypothetical protein